MIQHELYTPGSTRGIVTNDIGLILLRRPIQFNQYAQPVCLATNPPLINDILWATGWGDTNGKFKQQVVNPLLGLIENI